MSYTVVILSFSLTSAPCGELERVNNPAQGSWVKLGKSFNLTPELSIGVEEGDPNYVLGRVTAITVNSKKNILVLDHGFRQVQEYDNNGTYIRTIGRKGQGPGEFHRPTALTTDALDSLYVIDWGRIIVFDDQGKYARQISIPRTDGPPTAIIVDSDHNIYFSGVSMKTHRVIHKYYLRSDRVSSFCETYAEEGFKDNTEVGMFYGGGKIALENDNNILYSRTVPYEIRRFSPQGELLTVISIDHKYPRLRGTVISTRERFDPKSRELALTSAILPLADGKFLNIIAEPVPPGQPIEARGIVVHLFDESDIFLASKRFSPAMSMKCVDDTGRLYGYVNMPVPKVVRYRLEYQ